MATPSAPADSSKPATSKYNLRNPLPLSAPQEQEVQKLFHKRVRAECADLIKAFAECAVDRTVTATWVCRDQRLAMNSCMLKHATQENEDLAREEWFSTVDERRRAYREERAAVETRRGQLHEMMRKDEERRQQQAQKN